MTRCDLWLVALEPVEGATPGRCNRCDELATHAVMVERSPLFLSCLPCARVFGAMLDAADPGEAPN